MAMEAAKQRSKTSVFMKATRSNSGLHLRLAAIAVGLVAIFLGTRGWVWAPQDSEASADAMRDRTNRSVTRVAGVPFPRRPAGLNHLSSEKRRIAVTEMVERWLEDDPAAAAQWVAKELDGEVWGWTLRNNLLSLVASRWAAEDAPMMLAWTRETLAGSERWSAQEAGLSAWAEIGSDAMGEWISGGWEAGDTENVALLRRAAGKLVESMAASRPSDAADWAAALPEGFPGRELLVAESLVSWGKDDAVAVAAFVDGLKASPEMMDRARSITASAFMESDPKRALEQAWEIGGAIGVQRTAEAIKRLVLVDPKAALAAYLEMPENSPERASVAPFLNWAFGADHALKDQVAIPPGMPRDQVFDGMVDIWSQHDPGQAMDWLITQPLGIEDMETQAHSIMNEWVKADASGAAKWVMGQPEGVLREAAWKLVSEFWATADPAATLAFFSGPEASQLPKAAKNRALTTAVAGLAITDPRAAAGWAVANPDLMSPKLAARIAGQLAARNPRETQAWIITLPYGSESRAQAVTTLADSWYRDDLKGFSQWRESLDFGADREGVDAKIEALKSVGL